MDENIKEYRDKAIEVVENSYAPLCGFGYFGFYANLVSNNDLVELLKLNKQINKNSVINNIECGTYDEKLKQYFNKNEGKHNNIVGMEKKFEDQNLQNRYEELIKAINNDMPLSFFWLAGSIIEGVLCEYCKKNDIKSSNHNIEDYITAIEKDEKHKKIIAGTIKKIIQIYKDYRNTIHPDNSSNPFTQGKNLQNRKEELDDVIKFFDNDEDIPF